MTNKTACHWEFVTGDTGTYLRALELKHNLENHPEYDADEFFEHWYYDNATPENATGGSWGTPYYPNGWSMCAQRTTGQVSLDFGYLKNL